jgi:general secretion pathway protein D
MNRFVPIAAFASAVLFGGCAAPRPDTPEARLLDRRGADDGVVVDASTPEGARTIREEIGAARGAVVASLPYYGRERVASFQEEPTSRPAAPQDERGKAETRPGEPPLPKWNGPKLAIVFQEAALRDVVGAVASEMGVNALVPDELTQIVSVNFPSIDPLQGLDVLLRRHGHRLKFENDVLTVVAVERPRLVRTFTLKSNRAFDAEKLIKPLLNGEGAFIYDDLRHQLTISDEEDAIERVAAFVAAADARKPQVMIEALIVEVRRLRDSAHGAVVEFGDVGIGEYQGVARSLLAAAPRADGTAPFSLGVVKADDMLQVLLSARKGKSKLNVLSNPLVSAISGTKAEIKVIERVPYVKSTNTINVGGGTAATNSTEEIEFEEVGVTLTVTPDVGADRVIQMEVTPDVRELVDFVLGVPVIDTRKVTSHVLVRNNETLVIGGLLRSAKRSRQDKVPVLGDIPLIGDLLFTRETEESERVELMIFVTPHLVGFGADGVDGFHPQGALLGPNGRAPLVDSELDAHPKTPSGR